MSRRRFSSGFTLIEVLTVITVIAILATMAALSIADYSRRAALKNAARSIEMDLTDARTAARVRQQRVRMDFTAIGYTAYVDNNADNMFNAGDDRVLTNVIAGEIQLLGVGGFVVPPAGTVLFNTSGMNIVGGLPGTTQMTLNRTGDAARAYRITINQNGIIQVDRSETGLLGPWTRAW